MKRSNVRDCAVGAVIALGWIGCGGCASQSGLAASPAEIYLEPGYEATVSVVAVLDTGSTASYSPELTVSSSDGAIASVDGDTVTGVAEGVATLTISDGLYTATATVYVLPAGTIPVELVVTPATVACTPESEHAMLSVFAVADNGASSDVTSNATFSSSDSGVALVTGDGEVICVSEGDADITASYLGVTQDVAVAVGDAPPLTINVSPSTLSCSAGEFATIQTLAVWADGSVTDVTYQASYSSSNGDVAAVALGYVQCFDDGTATIIATYGGVTDTVSVDVD